MSRKSNTKRAKRLGKNKRARLKRKNKYLIREVGENKDGGFLFNYETQGRYWTYFMLNEQANVERNFPEEAWTEEKNKLRAPHVCGRMRGGRVDSLPEKVVKEDGETEYVLPTNIAGFCGVMGSVLGSEYGLCRSQIPMNKYCPYEDFNFRKKITKELSVRPMAEGPHKSAYLQWRGETWALSIYVDQENSKVVERINVDGKLEGLAIEDGAIVEKLSRVPIRFRRKIKRHIAGKESMFSAEIYGNAKPDEKVFGDKANLYRRIKIPA